MWDDKRKVGVLNDFDLAMFADQMGANGQDNPGTPPFMALDLLSEKGLRGEIPRLYRQEAESFAWSLIYLYLATVEGEDEENHIRTTNFLHRWLGGRKVSREARIGFGWIHHDYRDVPLAYPNARDVASNLHRHWLNRYNSQFLRVDKTAARVAAEQLVFSKQVTTWCTTPYEELEDDDVFQQVVGENMIGLWGLEAYETVTEMNKRYKDIIWNA